jgi:hypothetical protein
MNESTIVSPSSNDTEKVLRRCDVVCTKSANAASFGSMADMWVAFDACVITGHSGLCFLKRQQLHALESCCECDGVLHIHMVVLFQACPQSQRELQDYKSWQCHGGDGTSFRCDGPKHFGGFLG